MQKADLLLRTKLHLPSTRRRIVSRPRLQERIAQGLRGPLTLVTAPAGFGKTTLLASCLASYGMPVAWLSLDKDDNQPAHFLRYVITALRGQDSNIGNEAAQLLAAQQAPYEVVLTSLINDLDTHSKGMTLVLDDYQFISSQPVHEFVTFLIDHCPEPFHLVISTRSDPPLPLSRLRARGQTVELRTADLSFTIPEAAQFLNEVMSLQLDEEPVTVLTERTEGWIAGLQMAALSMRDRNDIVEFIHGFSGTNRYILDFLLEEVLASQPAEIRYFLLCTSILERLTASLCEAVLAGGEQEAWAAGALAENFHPAGRQDYQPVLEYLERENLFLVPLDDERTWYRYHHLFADLLRAQLHKSIGEPGVVRLHLHASEWYEHNDFILDAIHHASLIPDFQRIERLIEQNYIEMMNLGEMSWVRFWMGKLSKELVTRRPWLCLYEALSRSWFGQLQEANSLLNEAEKLIRSDDAAPDTQARWGYHTYVKSRVTAMEGDTHRAIELCRSALDRIPPENLGLQIDVNIALGYQYFLYGDFVNANKILLEMIHSANAARALNNPVAAYAVLARLSMYQGKLHDANDFLQKAALLVRETGGQHLGVTGLVDVGMAALLYEWNDVKTALVRAQQGLEFLPLWGKADDTCLAYITLARIFYALGNPGEAAAAVDQAAQLLESCGVFSEARNEVESAQVNVWMLQGDWLAVHRWSSALEKRSGGEASWRYEDELAQITLARVHIAQKKPEAARSLLTHLEESARSAGRQGRLIEILILKALALQMTGESTQACSHLAESLVLAEPEGYVRTFLDKGQPVQRLLAQLLAHTSAGPWQDYPIYLLSRFEDEAARGEAAHQKAAVPAALVEPLSPREMEVLHLLAVGQTNQEIARRLVVSAGTVKAHTASIYRKLDVANRTEAVARARQLGILS